MAGNKLTAGTNNLLAVIGDEETVVGMLLAGVGNVDGRKSSNFFVVDDSSAWRRPRAAPSVRIARRRRPIAPRPRPRLACPADAALRLLPVAETSTAQLEEAFHLFTNRKDIAILIINQYVAARIRDTIDNYVGTSPSIIEVPSKEHPYEPDQDAIHRRARLLLGIRE